MGRMKYTEEERNQIMIAFIRAAKEILGEEGIEHVSIRKVANLTGLNSATMYLYFANSDVLITMASMGYLERYCRTLAADMPKMQSSEQIFMHTWDVFSRYAFENPEIFYHIFYTEHASPLTEIVDEYYRLFPEQVQNVSGTVKEMLHEGPIQERSWKVFQPLAEERGMKESDARILNEMIVSYFRTLLEERRKSGGGLLESERLTERLKTALEIILHRL